MGVPFDELDSLNEAVSTHGVRFEYDVEADGRHIASANGLPGFNAYGATKAEAGQNLLKLMVTELLRKMER